MAELRDSFLAAIAAYLRNTRIFKPGLRENRIFQLAAAPARCCPGRIADGPAGCTCWEPVYDRDQVEVDPATALAVATGDVQPDERHRMCGDCAYRPASPEKSGQTTHVGGAVQLERLAAAGERFYCHDGFRSPVAWRHPAGMRIPADPDRDGDFQPLIVLGVPFRANGSPGLLCAGWAGRRRVLAATKETDRG